MSDPSAISGITGFVALFGSLLLIVWLLFGEEWDG